MALRDPRQGPHMILLNLPETLECDRSVDRALTFLADQLRPSRRVFLSIPQNALNLLF
jgi:hypothetical protein